jgi:hypothetical protein
VSPVVTDAQTRAAAAGAIQSVPAAYLEAAAAVVAGIISPHAAAAAAGGGCWGLPCYTATCLVLSSMLLVMWCVVYASPLLLMQEGSLWGPRQQRLLPLLLPPTNRRTAACAVLVYTPSRVASTITTRAGGTAAYGWAAAVANVAAAVAGPWATGRTSRALAALYAAYMLCIADWL